MEKRSGVGSGGDRESRAQGRTGWRDRWESRRGSVRHLFTVLVAGRLSQYVFHVYYFVIQAATQIKLQLWLGVTLSHASLIKLDGADY